MTRISAAPKGCSPAMISRARASASTSTPSPPARSSGSAASGSPTTRASPATATPTSLLHAMTDAMLGAFGAGDIGDHFPPADPQWRGAASSRSSIMPAHWSSRPGGRIDHVDVTIVCEAPRIGPYREAMRARIADLLRLPRRRISIKATTTERLGFTGRGEGIAAQAVATVLKGQTSMMNAVGSQPRCWSRRRRPRRRTVCLTREEVGDMAVSLLPFLIDAAAQRCRPHLAATRLPAHRRRRLERAAAAGQRAAPRLGAARDRQDGRRRRRRRRVPTARRRSISSGSSSPGA